MQSSELIVNSDGSIYHLGIQPEELADTVIFVGDPDRVKLVSKHFDTIQFRRGKREFVTHTGSIQGKRITVISTGISTDNIDIVLNEIDALANIDLVTKEVREQHRALTIIRLGTSGSIHPDIGIDAMLVTANAIGMDGLDRHYQLPGSAWKPVGWNDLSVYLNDIIDVPLYVTSAAPELIKKFGQFQIGTTLTCSGFYGPQGRSMRLPSRLAEFIGELHQHKLDHIPLTNMEMETAGIYLLAKALGHRAISINAILASRITGQFSQTPQGTVERMIEESLAIISELD